MTGNNRYRAFPMGLLFLAFLAMGNGLLLAPAGSLVRLTGAIVLLLLPGLAWTWRLLPTGDGLTRWTIGAGLSYVLVMTLGLILHYLPGSIPLWALLVALNALTLIPWLGAGGLRQRADRGRPAASRWLVAILLLAAIFRFTSLGYSEFQGDEALAMISAAEALEGHQDALFLRGKGPGEVLLPMVLWRLTGTVNEPIARLPFAVAGLLMVPTIYLLGHRLFHTGKRGPGNERAGLVSAGLLALNGFMVGFSRIVQYQALVVWMSGLALLCAWEWRATRDEQPCNRSDTTWAALTGAFLGAGLLAHYDAVLILPALVYVQISNIKSQRSSLKDQRSNLKFQIPNLKTQIPGRICSLLAVTGSLLFVAGLFYIPYALDPQAARTGGYLGDRIGDALLKNNLDSFFHFNVFYNSSYYLILTGLLVLGFLAWALKHATGVQRLPGGRYWLPALAVLTALGLSLRPNALRIADLDLAALPFALILLGAFLSPGLASGQRAVVAWLAVPFLGYNFAVAWPLTHIYTIVPAWTLLAGAAAVQGWDVAKSTTSLSRRPPGRETLRSGPWVPYSLLPICCLLLPAALFSSYLYVAYLRHDAEFWQDWPESQPTLFWSPYDELPPAGFFGFAHRTGWKEVGALYDNAILSGDYGSNEEPEVTTWYTRGAPRACDPEPEYYLIADDLIDPWPVDLGTIDASYSEIGRRTLPNGKGLTIYQARPTGGDLGHLEADDLARAFDHTATPAAFARSARGSQPTNVNLGGLVRLVGYDVDSRRAGPGGRIAVTLYWQPQAPIPDDYHVFVHLEGDEESGNAPGIWGQADGRPVCWTYPTFDWRPGQIIADQHAITIKPDTPPGEYPILVGMYRPETGTRLDVLDEAGNPAANFLKLTTVPVR